MKKAYEAINWNKLHDEFSKMFWDQNIRQFWVDEEIVLARDVLTWEELSFRERDVYEKILGGLTLLDTKQGGIGMPLIMQHIENLHSKAVFSFMGAMEQMHAKSYSSIFSTLSSSDRIDEIFEWIETNEHLQKKTHIVVENYENIHSKKDLYMALVTSVFLESFLFYSGFYYPLYLAGQGKLVASGEIINLIIRDEAIHGVYTGLVAQEIYEQLSVDEQNKVDTETMDLLLELYAIEEAYTHELYDAIGRTDDVLDFIKYNADKSLMNLGKDPYFNFTEEDINPIVMNGMKTETKNHDFFSTKGNGYIKSLNVTEVSDDLFDF